jgi:hypothetical protein
MELKMKSESILRTTINFEAPRLENLISRCEECGLPVQTVIKKAVKLYIDASKRQKPPWHTITYQDNAPQYKKLHFSMHPFEYDTYLDIKKLHRLSFSYIVAIALDMFLDQILTGDYPQSYPIFAYGKFCITKEDCTFWIFTWGIPTKTDTLELPLQEE